MAREERLRFLNAIGRLELRGTSPRQSRGRSGAVADRPSPVWRRRTRRDQSLPVRSRPSRCRKTSPRFAPWRLDDGTGSRRSSRRRRQLGTSPDPDVSPSSVLGPIPPRGGGIGSGGQGFEIEHDRSVDALPPSRPGFPPRRGEELDGQHPRVRRSGRRQRRPTGWPGDRPSGRSMWRLTACVRGPGRVRLWSRSSFPARSRRGPPTVRRRHPPHDRSGPSPVSRRPENRH
jgi:hypothetical protein